MDPRFADKLKTPMFGGQGFFNQSKGKGKEGGGAGVGGGGGNSDSRTADKKKDGKKEKREKNDSSEDVQIMSVDKQEDTKRSTKKGDKHKIEIDDRFRGVLTESRFGASEAAAVDQYGRKKNKNKNKSKNGSEGELSEFYTLGEDEEKAEEEEVQKSKSTASTAAAPSQSKGGKLNASSSKSEIESRLDYLNRLARGEISASGSDDDDEDEYDMNSSVEGSSGDDNSDIDGDGEETRRMIPGDEVDYGEATSRIAIQNCDWEHIGASDLLAILHSFCPAGKFVKNLTIYLSDFGKQRLEVDERFGPRNIWKSEDGKGKKSSKDDSDDEDDHDDSDEDGDEDEDDDDDSSNDDDDSSNEDDDEEDDGPKKYEKGDFERKPGDFGVVVQTDDDDAIDQKGGKKKSSTVQISSDINQDKLREYELSKLRYYFAVADCDCLETAMVLYEQLDGLEMEHSSMELDLRYIPDDISFTGRTVKDQCNSVKTDYEPSEFVINALQRTSVDCTWEDGDKARNSKLTTLSSWKTLNESDFQQYLASSDSSDNEDEIDDAEKRRRAKSLRKLVGGEDSDMDQDEEDGFFLKESSKKLADKFQEKTIVVHTKDDDSDGDSDGNGGRDYDVEETVFEAAKRKLAEKKKQKKLLQQKNKNSKNNKNNDDSDDNIVDTRMISASKGSKDKGFGVKNNKNDDSNKSKKSGSKSSYNNQDSDDSSDDEDSKSKMVKDKLDLMFSDSTDIANNYDMIEIMKREKLKSKKNKFKKSKHSKANDDDAAAATSAAQDSFQVDTKDPRFSRLYTDHTFGIDPTSTEFKKTNAMMKVVKHVSENRQQHIDDSADRNNSNNSNNSSNSNGNGSNNSNNSGASVQSLVNKLKRKFKDQ